MVEEVKMAAETPSLRVPKHGCLVSRWHRKQVETVILCLQHLTQKEGQCMENGDHNDDFCSGKGTQSLKH